jgi:hypothetical protein
MQALHALPHGVIANQYNRTPGQWVHLRRIPWRAVAASGSSGWGSWPGSGVGRGAGRVSAVALSAALARCSSANRAMNSGWAVMPSTVRRPASRQIAISVLVQPCARRVSARWARAVQVNGVVLIATDVSFRAGWGA